MQRFTQTSLQRAVGNIKALFFDIDGTLVSFNTHQVPASTLEAIHRVREKGVKVFIATGRPIPFINNLKGVEYDGIMAVNGAYCVTADGHVILKRCVPMEDIARMVEDAKVHPMPIVFAGTEKAIACLMDTDSKTVGEVMSLLHLPMPQKLPVEKALEMEVMQVIAYFTREQETRIMEEVLTGCDAARWHPAFADCICKGTSKATGIDAICEYYGIRLEETMAFGDGGNDIAMLRHAGIGVAMGNASDEVKEAADFVTTTVDDDGVANVLKYII